MSNPALFKKGTVFLYYKSEKMGCKTKTKYFIALNDADDEDDEIVCCVFNTVKSMDMLPHIGCISDKFMFIVEKEEVEFLNQLSEINFVQPQLFKLSTVLDNKESKIVDEVSDKLLQRFLTCLCRKKDDVLIGKMLKLVRCK